MIWLALAAQLSAPTPKAVWIHPADVPSRALGWLGYTRLLLRVTVDPNGAVQSCGVEESGGPSIDAYTCDLTMKRASFLPAQTADGKPSYGVYRLPVVWELSRYKWDPWGDLTLSVTKLPDGVKSPSTIELVFAADTAGNISSCEPKDGSQNPSLAAVACDQLEKQFKAIPVHTAAGATTGSVQNAYVVFEAK